MLHVDIPTRGDIESLIHSRGPARVSIYLPTTPLSKQAQADRIALKNLSKEALDQLADHDKREVRALEELLFDLIDDDLFWDHQANSLAVFATPERLQTFRLPNRLQPVVEASDQFLIKPLLRSVTVPQFALVLALAQNSTRVVEVTADLPAFALKVDGMPSDAASAVGQAKDSLRDRAPSGRIQGSEGKKVRLTQYARQVDQALRDLLHGRETPLILAATEPLLSIYRGVNTYPHLAKSVISTNPEAMSDADLANATRAILDELFRDELAEVHGLFEQKSNQWRTTSDVAQAARAATAGAIRKLLVDIDHVLPGTIDDQGQVQFAEGPCAKSHDIVDEIAARALLTGARVLAVRKQDLPGNGELAAVLRYAF